MPSPSVTPIKDIAPLAPMSGSSNTTLRELRDRMGTNADLLQYLPLDLVRVESFDDDKNERPNALPVLMHFGHIRNKNVRQSGTDVCILLHPSANRNRLPEQRFNLFSRLDSLQGSISVDDAIRTATYLSAFRCIKESGGMDKTKLRAVIRYYMIARIDLPAAWPVDARFVEDLGAACKLARANKIKQDQVDSIDKDWQMAAAFVSRHSVSPTGQVSPGFVPAPITNELSNIPPSTTPIPSVVSMRPDGFTSNNNAQRQPHLDYNLHATSLHERLYGVSATTPLRSYEDTQTCLSGTNAPTVPPDCNNAEALSLSTVGESTTAEWSKSMSIDTAQTEQSVPSSEEAADFVTSYRQILTDSDAQAEILQTNREEQDDLAQQIELLQDKMNMLKEEEKKVKIERRKCRVEKKRLRQTLSKKDRALLEFGLELAKRGGVDTGRGSDEAQSDLEN